MAYKSEKLEAHRMFLEENKSIEQIAAAMPHISIQSIYRWAADEEWQKEKDEIAMTSVSTSKQMLQTLVVQLGRMMETIKTTGVMNSSEVYSIRQLLLSVKALQRDVDNYGNVLLAIGEFTEWIAERDPDVLITIQPLLVEFGNAMSKKYGKKK
jgi:uncharacterized protein involved in tolerance to divalent cations